MTSSRRWFGLLLRLYPADFRDEMGDALVDTYMERARAARARGRFALAALWLRALADSLRNGLGERLSPAASWRRAGNWGRDAELALRRLRRAPAFALSIIGTLTVGLGAFGVVYAVVHQVLIAPLPYEEPDELYYAWRDYGPIFDLKRGWTAGTDVSTLAAAGGPIEAVAGLRRGRATLTGVTGEDPEEIAVMLTTPNLFDLLGVRPVLGRGFRADDAGEGRAPVIVLTHELWNRLGADPAILGRDIRIDDEPFTVIGVMADDFGFVRHSSLGPPEGADAYITFDYDLAGTNPGAGSYSALLRARDGATEPVVAAAVAAVGRAIDERDFENEGLELYSVPLEADLVADVRPALTVVGLAGVFLLIVLLVNLANLLLVRAVQREKEYAVSRALGANPTALVRATVLEGCVLGLLGGIGGALVAVWATQALVGLAPPDLPRRESIGVDWPIGLTIVATGGLLGLLAGILPAVWATRARLASLLSAAAVRGGGGHGRMRRGMVVVQVALSLVLLSAGGLVVRSFERLLRSDPGFDAAGVLTLRVPLTAETDSAVLVQERRINAELAAIPGVRVAGGGSALPLSAEASQTTIRIPGAPGNTGDPETDAPLVDVITTRPGWFEALGIRVIAGRSFEPRAPGGPQQALIDRQLARRFFPTSSALGARIPFVDDTLHVIGVVEHARLYDYHEDGRPQLYLRNCESVYCATLSYALLSDRDPTSLIAEARAAIDRVDPGLAMSDVKPMEQLVAESISQQRVSAVLIAGFSLGALLLAAMGLFGVVSGSVTRRRHELALRLALGADHRRVLRNVLGDGARLVALGLVIGVPGVYAAGRILSGVLIGVSPFDALTLAAVAVGLAAVALIACYVPARRVAGIEPARALREE